MGMREWRQEVSELFEWFFPRVNEGGISSSEASGESPLVLATPAFCALRSAWHLPESVALSIVAVSEKTFFNGSAGVIDPLVCGA